MPVSRIYSAGGGNNKKDYNTYFDKDNEIVKASGLFDAEQRDVRLAAGGNCGAQANGALGLL